MLKTVPTLFPVKDDEFRAAMASVTDEDRAKMVQFFTETDIHKLTFFSPQLRDSDGVIYTDIKTTVVGRYTVDGDLIVALATGDVVNISDSIRV